MPQHEVELKIAHAVQVGNVDLEIPVKRDGKPLGRLKISRGSVDWIPSPKAKAGYRLNWTDFADLMETRGNPIP